MKKIDLKKHVLAPKHTKLSEKEKEELLARYEITIAELPRIKKSDPMVAGLGAKSGDVIKIVRNSATAGKTTFYRVLIHG